MGIISLALMALLPAIVLCVYVYIKDRVEKEPVSLLLKLLLFGALACFPAAGIESVLEGVINAFFSKSVMAMGVMQGSLIYQYNFFKYFIGVALVEEAVKFLVLVLVTRKNKEFNSLFDGMIYSIFVSLGFAALENLMYVMSYGLGTAIMRAVLSVPGHMFFGVMMGYHYSMWHITDKAAQVEQSLKADGIISSYKKSFSSTKSIVMCLLIPILAHGFYDFCCVMGDAWFVILIGFVIFMYVHCFRKIKRMSNADGLEIDYVKYLIVKKYPGVFDNY